MSPLGFFLRVVVGLIAFAGLVLLLAIFQNWIETGIEEGPPDSHGDTRPR